MPYRNRDNLGKFFPNTHTASNTQPSLFFNGCELEEPLGVKPKIFEEPTGEEEEEEPIPTEPMAENKNDRGNRERIEGSFPIMETNGDTKIKKYKPLCLISFPWLNHRRP